MSRRELADGIYGARVVLTEATLMTGHIQQLVTKLDDLDAAKADGAQRSAIVAVLQTETETLAKRLAAVRESMARTEKAMQAPAGKKRGGRRRRGVEAPAGVPASAGAPAGP